jgi:hypothetical protein
MVMDALRYVPDAEVLEPPELEDAVVRRRGEELSKGCEVPVAPQPIPVMRTGIDAVLNARVVRRYGQRLGRSCEFHARS